MKWKIDEILVDNIQKRIIIFIDTLETHCKMELFSIDTGYHR